MANLSAGFPTLTIPRLLRPEPPPPDIPLLEDYAFDFADLDVPTGPGGQPIMQTPRHAWIQWCVKTCLTERYAYQVYSPQYGVEVQAALREPSRPLVQVAVSRTITEALLANSATASVGSFEFEWVAEHLYVSFIVTPHPALQLGPGVRIVLPPSSTVP